MSDYEIKDSGERREFDTGAVRDITDNKGRYDLLPLLTLRDLAIHYQKGCNKYGDRNWENVGRNETLCAMKHWKPN